MKKRYKSILCLSTLVLLSIGNSAQAQITTFQKHYATAFDQSGKDVIATGDGYIIAGATENSTVNDLDIQITKTDLDGNIQWVKTYGGNRPDYPNCITATSDGNYFIGGYTQSFGNWDYDSYLLKIKPNGDTLFTKVYGGAGNEEIKEIVPTDDGNYAMVGATNSISFSDNDMQLTKINLSGGIIWTQYYGGLNYESARSVKLCLDGGFIIAGKTAYNSTSIASLYLVKTKNNGDTLWTRTYSGGANAYEGKSIVANSDGSYTLAVDDSSQAFDSDVRIMGLNNTGGITWTKVYGGTDKDIVKMIQSTSDGGYIVGAISRSFGWGSPDMWVIKLDAGGNKSWENHFGGAGHEHCYAIHQTSDNGYIAIGHTRSYSSTWETYFLKLDPSGVVGINEFAMNDNILKIYPNPTSGIINLELSGEQLSDFSNVRVTNMLGQIIYSETLDANTKYKSIDLSGNSRGTYFVTFQSSKQMITKRLILN